MGFPAQAVIRILKHTTVSLQLLCGKLALAVMQDLWCINGAGLQTLLDHSVRSAQQLSLAELQNHKVGQKIQDLLDGLQAYRTEIDRLKGLISEAEADGLKNDQITENLQC